MTDVESKLPDSKSFGKKPKRLKDLVKERNKFETWNVCHKVKGQNSIIFSSDSCQDRPRFCSEQTLTLSRSRIEIKPALKKSDSELDILTTRITLK